MLALFTCHSMSLMIGRSWSASALALATIDLAIDTIRMLICIELPSGASRLEPVKQGMLARLSCGIVTIISCYASDVELTKAIHPSSHLPI